MSSTRAATNTFDECDLFEKAMQFSVIEDDDDDDYGSFSIKNRRSRYEKFLCLTRHTHTHAVRVRDREPQNTTQKPQNTTQKDFKYFA